jgi:hypothetical protein
MDNPENLAAYIYKVHNTKEIKAKTKHNVC